MRLLDSSQWRAEPQAECHPSHCPCWQPSETPWPDVVPSDFRLGLAAVTVERVARVGGERDSRTGQVTRSGPRMSSEVAILPVTEGTAQSPALASALGGPGTISGLVRGAHPGKEGLGLHGGPQLCRRRKPGP